MIGKLIQIEGTEAITDGFIVGDCPETIQIGKKVLIFAPNDEGTFRHVETASVSEVLSKKVADTTFKCNDGNTFMLSILGPGSVMMENGGAY